MNVVFTPGAPARSVVSQCVVTSTVAVGPPRARLAGVTGNWAASPVHASDLVGTAVYGRLHATALRGWEESSLQQYVYAWNTFFMWCAERTPPLCPLPAEEVTIAMYFQHRLDSAKSFSVLRSASAAIAAFHKVNLFPQRPTRGPLPSMVRECGKRLLGLAANRDKAPFPWEAIARLALVFCTPTSEPWRWVVGLLAVVCFAGFGRYNDFAPMLWQDIVFEPTFVVFRFVKRKHNVYKLKSQVRVARLEGRSVCPYALLQQWQARSGGPTVGVVFPGFAAALSQRCLTPGVPISYRRYRTCLSVDLGPFLELSPAAFLKRFGTQSTRSGGASAAANAGIPFEVWGQHGGWRSRTAQLVYMACDVPTTLSTTLAIMPSITEGDRHMAALVATDSEESDSEAET